MTDTAKLRELLAEAVAEKAVFDIPIWAPAARAYLQAMLNATPALLDAAEERDTLRAELQAARERVERLRSFAESLLVTDDWDYDDWCRKARAALEPAQETGK